LNAPDLDALKQQLVVLREQERTLIREADDAEGSVIRYQMEVTEAERKLKNATERRERLVAQLEKFESKIDKLQSRI
jgi:chromosome segregation ATPase